MGIVGTPLEEMSPKETIYLIGYLMHELTNYEMDVVHRGGGTARADSMSSSDILHNGLSAHSRESVQPLGVCRNFADTGEALFRAFKQRNPSLTNIYCHNAGGFAGATTGTFHREGDAWKGHAWLDFIAIGPRGDMAITTVDPTWVHRSGREITDYDMTRRRMGTNLRNIAAHEKLNYSTLKMQNLDRVRTFYNDRIEKLVDMLRRKYSNGGPLSVDKIHPDDMVLHAAMYSAVDGLLAAADFGGSSFHFPNQGMSLLIQKIIYYAAQREDLRFSPSEYKGVQLALRSFAENYEATSAQLPKIDKISESLRQRFQVYSQDATYKALFDANEGAFADHLCW
jgi:hypothetical protein